MRPQTRPQRGGETHPLPTLRRRPLSPLVSGCRKDNGRSLLTRTGQPQGIGECGSLTRPGGHLSCPGKRISTADATLMSSTGPLGRAPPRIPGDGKGLGCGQGLKGARDRPGLGGERGERGRAQRARQGSPEAALPDRGTLPSGPPHLSQSRPTSRKPLCAPDTLRPAGGPHRSARPGVLVGRAPQTALAPLPGLGVRPEFPVVPTQHLTDPTGPSGNELPRSRLQDQGEAGLSPQISREVVLPL